MSYHVRIESFEGPFDLLLYLVSRQKVDIGSIAISEIADQYLAEIERMRKVDLDIASDFLLVAATLLEMKAASLIPEEEPEISEDLDELTSTQMRDVLVGRLLEYKKFKSAACALGSRFEAQGRMHVRPFGPDRSLLTLMPDYLRGTTPDDLGRLCAQCFSRRDVFLLESEHIARRVISLEERVEFIRERVRGAGKTSFSELIAGDGDDSATVVVTFLALLELFKRRQVSLVQDQLFGDIAIEFLEDGLDGAVQAGDVGKTSKAAAAQVNGDEDQSANGKSKEA